MLVHAGDAAPEGFDDFDEAVGRGTRRRDLVLEREVEIPGKRVDGFLRIDHHLAVLEHFGAVGVGEFARIEQRPGAAAAHPVAVLVLVRLGEGFCDGEELVPGPVRCRLLEAELFQAVGAVVNPVERHGERKRDDLVVDGHGLPGRRRDIRVVLPGLCARGDVFDRAHAVELADPVVPDLAEIGRTSAGDRADELLTRLRLRHVFDLHREILLRLIEALGQRVHQRDARRLGNAPLKAHRLGAPGLARANERSIPPGQIGCGDDARTGQCVQQLATR